MTLVQHGLPSALGGHRGHHPGHHGRRRRQPDRRRVGRRPGALRARGHAGRRVQDRAARQPGADRRRSRRSCPTIPTCRWCSTRCSPPAAATSCVPEEMMDALRELLIPQTTIITPNSLEARRLADRGRRGRRARSRRVRAAHHRERLRVRARHRHPREHAAGRQHALRPERRRAQPTPGSACPAPTTARAARSPPRSPRPSPTASRSATR